MVGRVFLTSASACGFAILQSTVLYKLLPSNVAPDIAMIILVASALYYGSIPGEISGFFIGLCIDAISLAPFGFHAFIFVLIGYLSGKIRGSFSLKPILVPVSLAALATLTKYIFAVLLSFFFELKLGLIRYFSLRTVWELLANIVLAPLIFFIVFLIYENVDQGRRVNG